ncbi:hypothetical protein KBC70_02895 [Candidatus Woesebacteria bacterium]|nr:hypothetical protein [Candidatus Woesebacteria bacterium]
MKQLEPLGDWFTTEEWIGHKENGIKCRMAIVGSCLSVESNYLSAVGRKNKTDGSDMLNSEQYLYELRLLEMRLEFIIRRDKNHRPRVEQLQAAPVEAVAKPAVAKPKKLRTAKGPQPGVPIGVEPKSRRTSREVVKVAKAA